MAAPGFSNVNNPNPAEYAVAVTTSDSVNFANIARGLYIGSTSGGSGLSVLMPDDTTVVFSGVVAGSIIPVRAKRVNATGTTASSIVALF